MTKRMDTETPNMKRIVGVRLHAEDFERLKQASQKMRVSMSTYIRLVLVKDLDASTDEGIAAGLQRATRPTIFVDDPMRVMTWDPPKGPMEGGPR